MWSAKSIYMNPSFILFKSFPLSQPATWFLPIHQYCNDASKNFPDTLDLATNLISTHWMPWHRTKIEWVDKDSYYSHTSNCTFANDFFSFTFLPCLLYALRLTKQINCQLKPHPNGNSQFCARAWNLVLYIGWIWS